MERLIAALRVAFPSPEAIQSLAEDTNLVPPEATPEALVGAAHNQGAMGRLLDIAVHLNPTSALQRLQLEKALADAFPTPEAILLLATTVGLEPARADAQELAEAAHRKAAVGKLLKEAFALNPMSPELRKLFVEAAQVENVVSEDISSRLGVDPAAWRNGMARAELGVCRILGQEGQHRGTGFLVGDDLVCTNWHVCAQYPNDPDNSPLLPPQTLSVQFDFREGSLGGTPIQVIEYRADSRPRQLDYAILVLSHPLPDAQDRRLWAVRKRFIEAEPILLLQHPQDSPMRLTVGFVVAANDLMNRVSYKSETVRGSSGSPCFDMRWRLVAMHHYKQEETQAAIPLGSVMTDLGSRADIGTPVISSPTPAERVVDTVRRVTTGFDALEQFMRDPVVANKVGAAQGVLRAASRSIHQVLGYKTMHDILHELYVQVVKPIETILGPDLDVPPPSLARHLEHLKKQTVRAKEIASARGDLGSLGSVVQEIDRHSADFDAEVAVEKPDLRSVLDDLRTTVIQQLSSVNYWLRGAGETLDLKQVAAEFKGVLELLLQRVKDAGLVSQFADGIHQLERFHGEFRAALANHSEWQRLVDELKGLAGIGAPAMMRQWPKIYNRITTLAGFDDSDWAQKLRSDALAFGESLRADTSPSLSALYVLEDQADTRFYFVDKEFYKLCDSLKPILARLDEILDSKV